MYVNSSEIPGAKSGFIDLFKSRSKCSILIPAFKVTLARSRAKDAAPPRTVATSSPKTVRHQVHFQHPPRDQVAIKPDASCQMSHHDEDNSHFHFLRNPPINGATVSGDLPTVSVAIQDSPLSMHREKYRDHHHRSEQSKKRVKNTSPKLLGHSRLDHPQHVGDHKRREQVETRASPKLCDRQPSSNLTVDSRVQIATNNPEDPLAFGIIRWIGDVSSRGVYAGVEMVIIPVYILLGECLLYNDVFILYSCRMTTLKDILTVRWHQVVRNSSTVLWDMDSIVQLTHFSQTPNLENAVSCYIRIFSYRSSYAFQHYTLKAHPRA